jgi:hypothetical protein
MHDRREDLREWQAAAENDIRLQRTELERRSSAEYIDATSRAARARREAELDEMTEVLAARLRADGRLPVPDLPPEPDQPPRESAEARATGRG